MGRVKVIAICGAIVVIGPLLYALAAGPLVYMRERGRPLMSDESFAWIYHPLIRAEARIPPLGRAMHWYVSCWKPTDKQAAAGH